ncbi:hypothetical protein [Candidatus Sororendozoicomonas aggregata]
MKTARGGQWKAEQVKRLGV